MRGKPRGDRLGSGGRSRSNEAAVLVDVMTVLLAELADGGEDRRDRGIRKDADRHPVGHLVGDLFEEVDVLHATLARLDAGQNSQKPRSALAAGRALAAGLV